MSSELPIYQLIPQLKHQLLHHHEAILEAAPGAGKTTVVPIALMDEAWLNGRKIIMLEPRRLAAKAAAKPQQSGLPIPCKSRLGNALVIVFVMKEKKVLKPRSWSSPKAY
ncbi:hypothetical protein [Marinomonas sp.]|uniref:hypothetical protein n=1 Tax=Marinomonas sp. TaxID=1904862 RepID=UPI003BA95A84